MCRFRLALPLLSLWLLCFVGVLSASEADELRARAKALHKEAAASAERGDQDRAARLKTEAAELMAAAEKHEAASKGPVKGKPAPDAEARRLKERLHELRSLESKLNDDRAPAGELAKVREQIADVERALHAHAGGKPGLPPELHEHVGKLEAAAHKMHHLRAAAEHLKLADAPDLAQQLLQKAEAIEADIHAARAHLADQQKKSLPGGEHRPDVIGQLREEVERLRAEVRELRRQVTPP